ncbi:hypothetical protein LBMAG21_11280 [Armatimonadota bacterium]|nr:hypothetical protein LBMAG21_11280 [Armatimonadota bacterium]
MHRNLRLTPAMREEITRRYKSEKNPRYRERLHCLLLKDHGYTNAQTCQILMVSHPTLTTWLNLYETGGLEALCSLVTGGSDGFLTDEQIASLKSELDKHVFQTSKQVCHWVREEFRVVYSERGMRALLQRLGYSKQKAHLVPAQADEAKQASFLKGV